MAEISEKSLHTLPEGVIIEILLHVQDVKRVQNIKSIGRCKCVSKTWLSLLSRPQFAKSRLHGPENIFFLNDNSGEEDKPRLPDGLPYVATLGDHGVVAKKIELPFLGGKSFRPLAPVQGSCHGLVLLFLRQGLLLVNPTSLEAAEIPGYGGGYGCGFSLGYDSRTDDYKVVSIQKDNVDVYSVKTKTWKTLENPSSFEYNLACATRPFVNGRINFVSLAGDSVLAAFNVATEELESVPYPRGIDNFRAFDDRFNVLGGCLAMLVVDLDFSYDVWLMKEYGVQDSWTKFTMVEAPMYYRPLCFLDGDENELVSLEASKRKFVAYNRTSGALRDMVVDGMPDSIWTGSGISFRESLVSPNFGESVLAPSEVV